MPESFEVIVVGGGPVGLLLANLLGARGRRVLVVEKRPERASASMAIGVTPPSLDILAPLGLDQELVRRGVLVRQAFVHGERGLLGEVRFDRLTGRYPFILAVPLSDTLGVLEESLRRFPSVVLQRGVEVTAIEGDTESVLVVTREVASGARSAARASLVAGCDGARSTIRRLAGIAAREKDYGQNFLMADFEDRSGLGQAAHLFFTAAGSVESFPLPAGLRRWVISTDVLLQDPRSGTLEKSVFERTGHSLEGHPKHFESTFRPARMLAERFYRGRVALAGDAAHVMSPIGGQGMNTGFADAEFLAGSFERIWRERTEVPAVFSAYEFFRRRAFGVASARAARGMWLGTRRGAVAASVRDLLIGRVLLRPPVRDRLPAYFAMLTIPFSTLAHVPPEALVGSGVSSGGER